MGTHDLTITNDSCLVERFNEHYQTIMQLLLAMALVPVCSATDSAQLAKVPDAKEYGITQSDLARYATLLLDRGKAFNQTMFDTWRGEPKWRASIERHIKQLKPRRAKQPTSLELRQWTTGPAPQFSDHQ